MLVIRDKVDIKIKYPLNNIANKDKILFFDIETTGFSRQYCNIYLIGCLYFCGDQLMYIQWLADNFNDEANVLMAFHKFIQPFYTLIHFNGNSFDIPFVQERGEKYKLDFKFERFKSVDIYKSVSPIRHLLKTENQKQKTYEKLIGITRNDPFSGGDLIEVFKQYAETKDDRLIFPLLLHNKEDVINLGMLSSLLSLNDLFNHKFNISNYIFSEYTNINGDTEEELRISLQLDLSLPVRISYKYDDIYFKAENNTASLSIKVKLGTYKYYFKNYKDYYYLPLEDRALHKSIASFVDKKYRKQATAATCYEKLSGGFLPIPSENTSGDFQIFKENHNDKQCYINSKCITDNNILEYTYNILNYIQTKPRN